MTDLRPGTITAASGGHYRVKQDGSGGDMPVHRLVGTAPTVDQRVYWQIVEGRVLVLAYQDVS